MHLIKLDSSWKEVLRDEFEKEYMHKLKSFLTSELKRGKEIFPQGDHIFEAFNQTPFDKVKVVILGQDPYHGAHQAHGMCFSVLPGVKTPPSLVNIYKEIQNDLGITPPNHGYLMNWAKQGVLLLNTVLTVRKREAGSHRNKGWELFTDQALKNLSESREGLVFLLWGATAQKKAQLLDGTKHLVLKAPHPSPLSAYRGFFGCRHFSKANNYLHKKNKEAIDWKLPHQVL